MNKIININCEEERVYYYATHFVCIENPIKLIVKKSSEGGYSHRVKDVNGYWYYIPPKWQYIQFKLKEGVKEEKVIF